jgi:hypothetical protein
LGGGSHLLFAVGMTASGTGRATIESDPADLLPNHSLLLYELDTAVPFGLIQYGAAELNVIANPHHNVQNPPDVDGDGTVAPVDALIVINTLNEHGAQALPNPPVAPFHTPPQVDVNGDASLSPLDALIVINHINDQSPVSASAEGSDSVRWIPFVANEFLAASSALTPVPREQATSGQLIRDVDHSDHFADSHIEAATVTSARAVRLRQPLESLIAELLPGNLEGDWPSRLDDSLLDFLESPSTPDLRL